MIELWHCKFARSLRVLWALEELEIPFKLHLLPFPPRVRAPEYLEINPIGTVPFLRDGEASFNESPAICHYLAGRYGEGRLDYAPDHPAYPAYLNWLFQSDTVYTFPQALLLRYGRFEPRERRQPQVVEDYTQFALARMKQINLRVTDHEWLAGDKFTMADIAVGYSLYLGEFTGLAPHYKPETRAYLERLKARPAFQRADEPGEDWFGRK